MGVWTRDADDIVVRGLVKPVSNIGVSPTGETAVVFHPRENGDVDSTSQFYNHFALSLVDLSDYFTSAYQLAAEPESFASTPDGNIGFYTMKDQPFLELLDYRTFVPVRFACRVIKFTWELFRNQHRLRFTRARFGSHFLLQYR